MGRPQDEVRTLSRAEATRYYDRLGSWLDTQRVFEDPAVEVLLAHASFDRARSVFEFGCGTGRLAERLLSRELRADARYVGVDISQTMARLASRRLQRWGPRAEIRQTDGLAATGTPSASVDRFVSTYVFDLLSDADIQAALAEADTLLARDGLLCLASLTLGPTTISRLVTAVWTSLHALRPALVGGCRPLRLRRHLEATGWQILYRDIVVAFGFPSEVVVASRP